MGKALFIALHPDDETLGCGGTIRKFSEEGWETGWLVITDVYEEYGWSPEFIRAREKQVGEIRDIFRVSFYRNLGVPTTTVGRDNFGELVKGISDALAEFKPDIVFLPNRSDVHSDHRHGFEAAYSACKSFRAPFISKVLMYECLSETEFAPPFSDSAFIPNVFIDITDQFKIKCEALLVYASEVGQAPFPRSLEIMEALAEYRGSRIGVRYAEAFSLLFEKIT